MDNKFLNKLSTLFFNFSFLKFIIAFNYIHNPPAGWYQQVLPQNLPSNNQTTFKDSLTGYAVTTASSENKSYVIKTTNEGDKLNFELIDSYGREINDVEILNVNRGFACTDYETGCGGLYKLQMVKRTEIIK
ncbi:MAG: hypothetical protein HGGPFJEG_00670 [Ignavibacteria bacterium]|nr:hypothetical protein [Ignavibacteria bacterium]